MVTPRMHGSSSSSASSSREEGTEYTVTCDGNGGDCLKISTIDKIFCQSCGNPLAELTMQCLLSVIQENEQIVRDQSENA
jgi:hypothetical protein